MKHFYSIPSYIRLFFICIVFLVCPKVQAQNLSGFYTSNFTGINAVDFQPADIAGTQYKVDVLILGAKLSAFNRNVLFNNLSASKTQNQNTVALLLDNNSSNFLATGALYLPSVLYSLNKKTAFAFSTTVNAFAIGQKSSSNILSAFYSYQGGQNSFQGENSTSYINSWSSFNFTAAHVLHENKRHRLKIGTTAKIAQGTGSAYFSVGNLGYTVDNHAINNLNADVQYQYNKHYKNSAKASRCLCSASLF
ncbi:MAG: hypothetical protein H7259_01710 [Cytophagales bacterium]|nr:hypothetical protein [Cytophaga sp.]